MQNNENQTQHSKSWCSQICCCKKKNKKLIQAVDVEEETNEEIITEEQSLRLLEITESNICSSYKSTIQQKKEVDSSADLNSLVVYKLMTTDELMSFEDRDQFLNNYKETIYQSELLGDL